MIDIIKIFLLWTVCQGVYGQNVFQKLFHTAASLFTDTKIKDIHCPEPEYDFIIVGAGSAGSILASRLSDIYDWKILLIEAGDKDTAVANIPGSAPFMLLTDYNWEFKSDPGGIDCLQHNKGVCTVSAGRVLGGTSAINFLFHARGAPQDYDDWKLAGNPGWGYRHMLPYFKKFESTKIRYPVDYNYRGAHGPIPIESPNFQTGLLDSFFKAGQELGYSVNDPSTHTPFGFSRAQGTMLNNVRISAAKGYLAPICNRTNLHISIKSIATKIVIDPITSKAIGVEFTKDRKKYFVRASKEVIVSAGGIKSPQLLMLSGIGPQEHLRDFSIPLIKDLRVGFNHQDHALMAGLTFIVNSSALNVWDNINPRVVNDYFKHKRGQLTLPGGGEAMAFIKTNISFIGHNTPDLEIILYPGGVNRISSNLFSAISGYNLNAVKQYFGPIQKELTFNLVPILLKPKSRGRVKLKSRDPFAAPSIRLNYCAEEDDMKTFIDGIRTVIRLGESQPFKRHNSVFYRAPFPGCEHYHFDSDDYWKCCVRGYAYSLQHHAGTCKMGPLSDPYAVVNHELKVHGVQDLRVIDASIFPTIPSAHTNSIVYAVAEKAADMIKSEWTHQHLSRYY